jgi:hypothetical protein
MHAALVATVLAVGSHGVSARVPPSWHTVSALTPCTNPIERLDVAGPGGALVMIQEAVGLGDVRDFPQRPRRFAVRGAPSSIACCDAPGHGKGWLLRFRTRGRTFYAYVYPGRGHRVREALQVLDGLRVSPSHTV